MSETTLRLRCIAAEDEVKRLLEALQHIHQEASQLGDDLSGQSQLLRSA